MSSLSKTIQDIYGAGVTVTDKRSVHGGDINESFVLMLSNGQKVFAKQNTGKAHDFFEAEAKGLSCIAQTKTTDCAKVIATGEEGETSFLLLEYIESGSRSTSFWETFGTALAALHRADTKDFVSNGTFGLSFDNYIGATRQINNGCSSWIDFYRTERLEAQFKMAWDCFDANDRKRIQSLLDNLDKYLTEPASPSLLHGDLWGGNFMVSQDGQPVLIDPAVYVGHAEADIAMTQLFGGFAPQFYDAYKNVNPIEKGYSDRRDLYNLYHLLNHLNLFGGSYLMSVLGIVRRYS